MFMSLIWFSLPTLQSFHNLISSSPFSFAFLPLSCLRSGHLSSLNQSRKGITQQIEMDISTSNKIQGQGRKLDKSRRVWSVKEEEVLISAMKDILTKGWKYENGFRTGYLLVLERAMFKVFPGTDIRAEPHINSKLHVWKKYHKSLTSMFARRGIGWNGKEKMIEAEDDAWNAYVKIDSNARTMRYKSWPFYNDWCEIYGNDPITRENAEDLVDAAPEGKIDTIKEREMAAEFGCCIYEGLDDENEMSVCHPRDSRTEKKQIPKKRKFSDHGSDALVEAIALFCETINSGLADIAERIGHDHDVSTARKEVYAALGKIPGLSLRDKIIAAKFLVNKTPEMELFFSLPDDARAMMVNMLLAHQL